jgi:hypothetical protein
VTQKTLGLKMAQFSKEITTWHEKHLMLIFNSKVKILVKN